MDEEVTQYRVGLFGLIVDEKNHEIGPAVDRHTVVGTGRMDGWHGIRIRLWSDIMTSGRKDLSKADINHNVQFRMETSAAIALARAILDEFDPGED